MSLSVTIRAPVARRTAAKHSSGSPLLLQVARWDQRLDGPLTEAAVHRKLEALGYDPLPRSNPAGAIASARVHHRERAAAVLAGLLKVTIDDQSVILTAGDIVFIPSGTARRIESVGTSPVLGVEAVRR